MSRATASSARCHMSASCGSQDRCSLSWKGQGRIRAGNSSSTIFVSLGRLTTLDPNRLRRELSPFQATLRSLHMDIRRNPISNLKSLAILDFRCNCPSVSLVYPRHVPRQTLHSLYETFISLGRLIATRRKSGSKNGPPKVRDAVQFRVGVFGYRVEGSGVGFVTCF